MLIVPNFKILTNRIKSRSVEENEMMSKVGVEFEVIELLSGEGLHFEGRTESHQAKQIDIIF